MGYGTRMPTSNDPPGLAKSPWGADEYMDDFALLLNAKGARCKKCSRVTKNIHLENGLCPDCRENMT